MKTKSLLLSGAFVASMLIAACSGLVTREEDSSGKTYGPLYSPQEHQMRTFDALLEKVKGNYIYAGSAQVDWGTLGDTYSSQIESRTPFPVFDRRLKSSLRD